MNLAYYSALAIMIYTHKRTYLTFVLFLKFVKKVLGTRPDKR